MNLVEKCGCLSLLLLAHLCYFPYYCSASPEEETSTVSDTTTDRTTPPTTTLSTNHSQTINSRTGRTEKKIKGGSSYEDHYYSGPIYGQVNSYGYGNNHDHYGGNYNNAGKGKGKGKGKGEGKGKGSSRPYYPPLPPAPYIPSAPAYGSGYKGDGSGYKGEESGYKGESYAPGYKDESKEYSPPAYGEVHGTGYSSDYGKPTGDAYKGHGYSGDSYGKGPGYVQPIYYYVYYPYERPKKGWFKKVSDKVSDAKAKHLEEKGKKLQEKGYQLITKGKELESYGQSLNDYSANEPASYESASGYY